LCFDIRNQQKTSLPSCLQTILLLGGKSYTSWKEYLKVYRWTGL